MNMEIYVPNMDDKISARGKSRRVTIIIIIINFFLSLRSFELGSFLAHSN
jgi:hypothetical protein